ncbi:MAG: hypothetical protein AVDCRST_MAG22-1883 [uncultured Rubrobacteraceae bacterium]|uniref:Uncharacterized protein n=1 Tax=uncultured Rubrobacteraceae bacterium TaxID=349277 RepID=A0A6J4PAW3_9ACTN|nr:MAG: hypothetical protein AVDCRST_MAG22-1883 [uncultured Rubrobacteraceae bacterium]
MRLSTNGTGKSPKKHEAMPEYVIEREIPGAESTSQEDLRGGLS